MRLKHLLPTLAKHEDGETYIICDVPYRLDMKMKICLYVYLYTTFFTQLTHFKVVIAMNVSKLNS
jgi:hypothetical protein